MQTEFEVKLLNIDVSILKEKVLSLGGRCTQERTFMKRVVFDHPTKGRNYLRIRDEGEKITLTTKDASGEGIEMVKELETTIGSFATMQAIIERLGLPVKTYQETWREVREVGSVSLMIDERPWLSPFVEIEGSDEQSVAERIDRLGYKWPDVVFGAVDEVYHRTYGVPHDRINTYPQYVFTAPCPF